MDTVQKKRQLQRSKWLATGLLLIMLLVYIFMVILSARYNWGWIGYVEAFSEAAMVGALADWFAVTALFHRPLGLPIPHTNLIERGKRKIGDNLGEFVVANFLMPGNIRPYLERLSVSSYLGQWLEKEKNKAVLAEAAGDLLRDILEGIPDEAAAEFIAEKGKLIVAELRLNQMAAGVLLYFVQQGEHQKLITLLAGKIKGYIRENEEMVRQRVKKESYFFIPKFVDNKLAQKIARGLIHYFDELENTPEHPVRAEISGQLTLFADRLRNEEKWEKALQQVKDDLLQEAALSRYALAIWRSIKGGMSAALSGQDTALRRYLNTALAGWSQRLRRDAHLRKKLDDWIRLQLYRLILRYRGAVQTLISQTIGNWQGRELSRKLELEVGKDLQFIRVNGTLVGGMVGLVIYWLTRLLQ